MYPHDMFDTPNEDEVVGMEMTLMDEIFQATVSWSMETEQNWPDMGTEDGNCFSSNHTEKPALEQDWTIDELLIQAAAADGIIWLTNANQNQNQHQHQSQHEIQHQNQHQCQYQNQNSTEQRPELPRTVPCENARTEEKRFDSSQMVAQVVECELVPYDDNAIYLN